MEVASEASDFRQWDELIPDALGLIFKNLSLKELLTVIPMVCKSWGKAVMGPYCWQEVDIEEWSDICPEPQHLDRMIRMLISRSCGSLRKLCVSGLKNDMIFSFIAEHSNSLQTLSLPRSEISDSIVEQTIGRLSHITFLDLSCCGKIGFRALEVIGKNCKLLVKLFRNMHPLDIVGMPIVDDEANAIAATMPRLKHLEMAYHVISTESALQILKSCTELELLDLRGCWGVKLDDEKYLEKKFPKVKVLGPLVQDRYEENEWDDNSDYSDASSEYLAWEFVDDDDDFDDDGSYDDMWDGDGRLEQLELRFYQGNEHETEGGFGWPPSP
ncbi:F-box protein FBW2-like [Rosa rugosa]|uniref:F-box protein FBW2-like n=1 Tax=Rosa rugosa TaxID=74645 RepID=UPI002B411ED1|nr:F-box protein FBW2-like [Rosa rugosa]XP_061988043.1 F-box protein FBW2-like [Rosa rugosa]